MWFLTWLACGDSTPNKDGLGEGEIPPQHTPREDMEAQPILPLAEDPPVSDSPNDGTDGTTTGGSGGSGYGGYTGYYGGSGYYTTRTGGSGYTGGSGLGARTLGPPLEDPQDPDQTKAQTKYLFQPR
jgi:hypothetical protein